MEGITLALAKPRSVEGGEGKKKRGRHKLSESQGGETSVEGGKKTARDICCLKVKGGKTHNTSRRMTSLFVSRRLRQWPDR